VRDGDTPWGAKALPSVAELRKLDKEERKRRGGEGKGVPKYLDSMLKAKGTRPESDEQEGA